MRLKVAQVGGEGEWDVGSLVGGFSLTKYMLGESLRGGGQG